MFSTILKEVTGYFDRRALLSAFFPSLIAWLTTLFLWLALSRGLSNALAAWEKAGALMTGLLILAFLVWCAFWSFLTLNFRAGLTRLFEGHWPFALWLEKRRRKVQKDEYDRRDTDDQDLDDKGFSIDDLRTSLLTILEDTQKPVSPNPKAEEKLDQLISQVEAGIIDWERLTIEELRERITNATEIAKLLLSAPHAQVTKDSRWERRHSNLDTLIRRLDEISLEIRDERERRIRNFNMYYPPGRHEVMPTSLGNVLRAADLRVGKRYHLDAGLVWSRLQPDLPKEFAESLHDSRMALDMMLTLSGFCLLFGLVQSLMLTYKLPLQTLTTAPLILTILVPIAARRFFQLEKRGTILVAAATVMILIALPLILIAIMVKRGFWYPLVVAGDTGLRLEAFLVLMTGYAILAWMVYGNAVHAAVAYGERIQSAFDLYRWKVFDGLHLQQPGNFADEQRMWEEVSALLATSKTPDDRYYRYIKGEHTNEAEPSPTTAPRPVPVRDLPPYTRVSKQDLKMQEVVLSEQSEDIASVVAEVANRVTLSTLGKGQPIAISSLVEVSNPDETVVVEIPAPASGWQNDAFQAGDVIDIVMVLPAVESTAIQPVIFENILLLAAGNTVTVALPLEYRSVFSELSASATVVLTKRL